MLAYCLCFGNFEQLVLIMFEMYETSSGYLTIAGMRKLLLVGEEEGCYDTSTTQKIVATMAKALKDKPHNSAAVLEVSECMADTVLSLCFAIY